MAILRGGLLLFKEQAIGVVNGINTVFMSSFNFIPVTLRVYVNGLEQFAPTDYIELTGNSFEFIEAPIGGNNSDIVTIVYQRA